MFMPVCYTIYRACIHAKINTTQQQIMVILLSYLAHMKQTVADLPALNMPDVCTASPVHKQAFCLEHCQLLQKQTPPVPTDLHSFLQFCKQKAPQGNNLLVSDVTQLMSKYDITLPKDVMM